jgi:hypothetical protein
VRACLVAATLCLALITGCVSSANLPFEKAWQAVGAKLGGGDTHAIALVEYAGASYWVVTAATPVLAGVEPPNVARQRLLLAMRSALARQIGRGESHVSLALSGVRILRIWQDEARLVGLGYVPEQNVALVSGSSHHETAHRPVNESVEDWRRQILEEIRRMETEIKTEPASPETLETLHQLYISVGDFKGADQTADAMIRAKFRQ